MANSIKFAKIRARVDPVYRAFAVSLKETNREYWRKCQCQPWYFWDFDGNSARTEQTFQDLYGYLNALYELALVLVNDITEDECPAKLNEDTKGNRVANAIRRLNRLSHAVGHDRAARLAREFEAEIDRQQGVKVVLR